MPLALLAVGCTNTQATVPPSKQLRIGATAIPDSMDPTADNNAAVPQALLYNVYETLVKLDGEGRIRPLLAKEWTISTDGLTYTFNLQSGATFANGDPVTADAVVKSFERIKTDPTVTSVNKDQMSVVSTMTAVDDTTVQIVLSRPSNAWLYDMTGSAGIIVDPAQASDLANTPAGSGPFTLKQWSQGDSVVLQKSPKYWGTPARFELVTFRYFTDPNAMNAAMLSGDLDIISNVAAPQALSQFSDTSKYQIIKGVTNGEIVLGFNDAEAPFTDLRVRQAICYAIDRKALMDSVWAGQGTLIGSMVPPTDPWYEDLSNTYPYNPAKAKELLDEAGYSGGLTLNLQVPTLPYATGAAQFIASQLKDVGITVNVSELDFPARWIDQVMVRGDYDMTIIAHVEPRDIVKWADPTYYWHYNNPDFQALIAQADKASADDETDLMKQAARLLATDAAGDFLWLLPSLVVAAPDLTGIPENAISLSFDLTNIASKNG
ncbi:MAG: ABC transporter substrate-binding protein [Propionibacteriaceae bacterium]|nr:ABC transporter substrate-binding protein [Propionibacteriaceae bacterium]